MIFVKIVLKIVFELHIIELPKIKRLLKRIKIVDEERELAKLAKFFEYTLQFTAKLKKS